MTLFRSEHGLLAMRELLKTVRSLQRGNDEWLRRLYHWKDDVEQYRGGLKSDSAVQAFEAEYEAARLARAGAATSDAKEASE